MVLCYEFYVVFYYHQQVYNTSFPCGEAQLQLWFHTVRLDVILCHDFGSCWPALPFPEKETLPKLYQIACSNSDLRTLDGVKFSL